MRFTTHATPSRRDDNKRCAISIDGTSHLNNDAIGVVIPSGRADVEHSAGSERDEAARHCFSVANTEPIRTRRGVLRDNCCDVAPRGPADDWDRTSKLCLVSRVARRANRGRSRYRVARRCRRPRAGRPALTPPQGCHRRPRPDSRDGRGTQSGTCRSSRRIHRRPSAGR
jgi:hypothetical protein